MLYERSIKTTTDSDAPHTPEHAPGYVENSSLFLMKNKY